MARDRQRAKARKQRQAPQPSSRTDEGNGRSGEGALSGGGLPADADREAGAGPDVAGPTPDERGTEAEAGAPDREADAIGAEPDHLHRSNVPGAWQHGGEVDQFEAGLVAGAGGQPVEDPDAVERAAVGDADGDGEPPRGGGAAVATADAGEPASARGGPRFLNFLRACWAELQRVQWPDRRQVGQATMVVLGFLVVAGAFLGAADFVANEIVNLII